MSKSNTLIVFIVLAVFPLMPGDLPAKCARLFGNQHCLELTFKEPLPPLTTPEVRKKFWSASYCEGVMVSGTNTYKVIFTDRETCPAVGEKLVGNLSELCQDTGRWTEAHFVFDPKPDEYCRKSPAVRIAEVNRAAQAIKAGMTRAAVADIFQEVDSSDWQKKTVTYYEHPEVLIEVPYDKEFQTVVGTAKVYQGNAQGGTFTNWSPRKKHQ